MFWRREAVSKQKCKSHRRCQMRLMLGKKTRVCVFGGRGCLILGSRGVHFFFKAVVRDGANNTKAKHFKMVGAYGRR